MKLLHITATHLNKVGGIPVVLKELVDEQNKIDGLTARVVSLVAPVNHIQSNYFCYIPVKRIADYVDEYLPDLVVLHSFFYLEYNYVVNVLRKKGIPYYIEPHGSFGKAALNKSRLKKMVANYTLFRNQLKYTFGYIFLNEGEKEDSRYRTDKDVIIPNGINHNCIKRDIYSKMSSLYYIGCYDIECKGLDCLMAALKIIDEISNVEMEFKMWGGGRKSEENKIRDMIKKLII